MKDDFINNSWGDIHKKPEAALEPLVSSTSPTASRQPTPKSETEEFFSPPSSEEIRGKFAITTKPAEVLPKKPAVPSQAPNLTQPTQAELERGKSPFWKQIIKAMVLFVGTFIFIYLFLTFPAQWQKIKYFFDHLGKASQPQTIVIPQVADDSQGLFLSSIQQALENAQEPKPENTTNYSLDISDLENNTLLVPKIGVKVPIAWNSPPDEETMMKNLQSGVVHYAGTGLPNQPDGNVFISGHSSYYWWDKGNYKTIFATLDNLEVNDEIALAYEDQAYIYKVYEKLVVKPEQVEVLDPVGKPILSLMTCVPVGTNLRRLVIRAERIDIATKEKTSQPIPASTSSPMPTTTPTSTTSPSANHELWDLVPWLD